MCRFIFPEYFETLEQNGHANWSGPSLIGSAFCNEKGKEKGSILFLFLFYLFFLQLFSKIIQETPLFLVSGNMKWHFLIHIRLFHLDVYVPIYNYFSFKMNTFIPSAFTLNITHYFDFLKDKFISIVNFLSCTFFSKIMISF